LSSSDNPQFEQQPLVSGDLQSRVPTLIPGDPVAQVTLPPAPTGPPPVENPVWSGWDVLLVTLLIIVSIGVLQFGLVLAAQRFWYPNDAFYAVAQRVGEKPILVIISTLLVYVPVAFLMIALVEGKYHVPFWESIRWNWPRSEWKWLVLGAATFFALALLQAFLPMPKDTPFDRLFDRPRDAYLIGLLAVTAGPLMEELFFRGFMYPMLARRMGVIWAIFFTALPFGLLHLQQYGWAWAAGLVIFLVGVVCGAVRAATKSVGASFLVHVGYNGMQMVLVVALTHGFRHMDKALALF
jgi:hypothetical protein